jgi:SagB-type dehydrogenase family enzyme
MRQNFFYLIACLFILMGVANPCSNARGQEVTLPPHQKNVGSNLMKALQDRQSVRTFSDKSISNQILSNLLWAANGENRKNGKRTAPSAINAQDIELYACKSDGVYHYIASDNKLEKVSNKDLRTVIAGRNTYIMKAPVVILLVSDQSKFRKFDKAATFGALDAGYVSQNICLYCSATGLNTVPCYCGTSPDAVQKVLGVSSDFIPMIYNPVGY